MLKDFQEAQVLVSQLVKQFQINLPAYRAPSYKEAQARLEFIDKFFVCLGWDVNNTERAAPQYKEVEVEPTQEVEGNKRAPDYAFRIGDKRKFFVEAKKPGVSIRTDAKPAYQVRRYAWSARLPLSILTDFEEFAVYDCRSKPALSDQAGVARINFIGYEQYPDRWREIWDVFSREAVRQGSFDGYADQSAGKRGTTTVDLEFLREIEGWRSNLARNFALRNAPLGIDDLNDAVQRTIDRIIFLRMAEDRGIEPQDRLLSLTQGGGDGAGIYENLLRLFKFADAKYNSGLFDFESDRLTGRLKVDDGVLKPIIASLYYPNPYEFSVMPAEILGNVYEQFLGKVIRLTPGHRAKIEEKPAVKKAGGVYYTPSYIVDYIVRNSIGRKIDEQSRGRALNVVSSRATGADLPLPKNFRILDVACGSGSFLLGAYQHILDHSLQWYCERVDPDDPNHAKALVRVNGEWRLTTAERKRLLLAHIFGVDIDRQAVEVTKLSLLLKVLEGENEQTIQMELFSKKRALPNLDQNIKCGNSLIEPDYFANNLFDGPSSRVHPDPEEYRRVNPFCWRAEFPEIMSTGGFDCIIGNPPYIRMQTMSEWAPAEVTAYKQLYETAKGGNYDIYVVFVERALQLLKPDGLLGFIMPHKFFNAKYGEALRSVIARGRHLSHVVHFKDQQVFEGATTYTCLTFLDKAGADVCRFKLVDDLGKWRSTDSGSVSMIEAQAISSAEWQFGSASVLPMLSRLRGAPAQLGNVVDKIYQGLATSADSVFVLERVSEVSGKSKVLSRELEEEVEIESDILHPLLRGSEIARYLQPDYRYVVLFPYRVESGRAIPMSERELKEVYPGAFEYLARNKARLLGRSKTDSSNWWLYPYPKNLTLYGHPKILCQVLSQRGNFSADFDGKYYFLGGGTAGGNAIRVRDDDPFSLKVLLGILNSPIATHWVRHVGSAFRGGYFAFGKGSLAGLPVPFSSIDAGGVPDRTAPLAQYVDALLGLHRDLAAAATIQSRELIKRQIDSIDRRLNALLYEWYQLTDDEIRIAEEVDVRQGTGNED